MPGAVDKLFYTIGLIDKVSGPAKGVSARLQEIQKHAGRGFGNVALGAGAVYGAAKSLEMFTGPARDFNKALGEVASLDVPTDELDRLGGVAKKFTMQFGGDAASVVASAYDIQSAIPGLAKGALAAFTYQGAVLAKAGKSNSATITKYMGTMYNIFEEDAKKVGQAQWVEQLTGKTAYAIKMFKTTGDEMSAAFTNVGSVGKSAGVSMEEQIAVLGTLQGTMGGANAGTAYAGMLNKVVEAQSKLGMSGEFLDPVTKKMLPITEMLGKIKGKFGDIDAKESAQIMDAFGEVGGKAVLNLLNKTEQLKGSITDLGQIKGSAGALKMAEAMTDPADRFSACLKVIKITLGQSMLPIINILLNVISRGLIMFEWLLENIPPLRWIIAGVILTVTALSAAWGVMTAVLGIQSLLTALSLKWRLLHLAMVKTGIITRHMTVLQKLAAVSTFLWGKATAFCTMLMNPLKTAILAGSVAVWGLIQRVWLASSAFITGLIPPIVSTAAVVWGFIAAAWAATVSFVAGLVPAIIAGATAMWAFAAALWATGIPEVILIIAALIGVLVAVWYWWDDITAAVVWCGKKLGEFFSWVGSVAAVCWSGILDGLQTAIDWLSDKLVPVVQFVGTLFEWLGGLGSMVWSGLQTALSNVDGWIGNILRTLAKIPGLGGLSPDISVNQAQTVKPVVSEVAEARKSTVRDVSAGGINQRINNNSTNWGGVTINTSSSLSPGDLEEWAMLQAW